MCRSLVTQVWSGVMATQLHIVHVVHICKENMFFHHKNMNMQPQGSFPPPTPPPSQRMTHINLQQYLYLTWNDGQPFLLQCKTSQARNLHQAHNIDLSAHLVHHATYWYWYKKGRCQLSLMCSWSKLWCRMHQKEIWKAWVNHKSTKLNTSAVKGMALTVKLVTITLGTFASEDSILHYHFLNPLFLKMQPTFIVTVRMKWSMLLKRT